MELNIKTNEIININMEVKLSTGYFSEKRLKLSEEAGDYKEIIKSKVKLDFLNRIDNMEIKRKNDVECVWNDGFTGLADKFDNMKKKLNEIEIKSEQDRGEFRLKLLKAEQDREKAEHDREKAEHDREKAEHDREKAEQDREEFRLKLLKAEHDREKAEQDREEFRLKFLKVEQENNELRARLSYIENYYKSNEEKNILCHKITIVYDEIMYKIEEKTNRQINTWYNLIRLSKNNDEMRNLIRQTYNEMGITNKEWDKVRNYKSNRNNQVHSDEDPDKCINLISENTNIEGDLKNGLIKFVNLSRNLNY